MTSNLICYRFRESRKEGVITVEVKEQKRMLMLLKECSLTEDIFPYFVTNSERMEVELEDPYICYMTKVSSLKELLPVLEPVAIWKAIVNYC
jgi:chaperonin GroEL